MPTMTMFCSQVAKALATAKVFYLAGFSLSLGKEVIILLPLNPPEIFLTIQVVDSFISAARHGSGILVVNLSASFVCRDFTHQLLDSMRQDISSIMHQRVVQKKDGRCEISV